MDELWDIARTAEYLGVSQRTVYNKVRAGELPATKVGRLWRVRRSELEAWLRASARGRGVAGGPTQSPGVPGPYPRVSAIQPELVAETRPLPMREDLVALLAPLSETLERRLAFVGLLSQAVVASGWAAPVVVGGHAVEYYTAGDYATVDIDLAGASEPIADVLAAWGFEKQGRHWFDESLRLLVEVPGSRLGPEELEHVVGVRLAGVTSYVLGPEDLIIDRLCAAKYWSDADSRLWGGVVLATAQELDRAYLCRRAEEEDVTDELEALLSDEGV